jgi:hypothetical protein
MWYTQTEAAWVPLLGASITFSPLGSSKEVMVSVCADRETNWATSKQKNSRAFITAQLYRGTYF